MAKKRIIWSNDYDKEDYEDDFLDWCEVNEYDPDDKDIYEYISESLSIWLDDERAMLSDVSCGDLLVIADLGLWDGRHGGYKIIKGNDLSKIFDFSGGDTTEFYCDAYNVRARAVHHDGTNYFTIREIVKGKERALKKLCEKIYEQENFTPEEVRYCTRSIRKKVANLYGW